MLIAAPPIPPSPSPPHITHPHLYPPPKQVLIAALARPAWALGVAIVSYLCFNGQGKLPPSPSHSFPIHAAAGVLLHKTKKNPPPPKTTTGYWVNSFLSAPAFAPLSFLSYTVYLTHYTVLNLYMASLTGRVRWDFFEFVVM